MNSYEKLLQMKKTLALFTSLWLIILAVWFSQLGFGIESNGKYVWVGWFLGLVVTVVELVFNTSIRKLNPTLIGAGVLAYGYGIYTNIEGLSDVFAHSTFAYVVGLLIEVLAEPLFAWSVGVYDGGDVIGNIGSLFGFSGIEAKQPSPPVNTGMRSKAGSFQSSKSQFHSSPTTNAASQRPEQHFLWEKYSGGGPKRPSDLGNKDAQR